MNSESSLSTDPLVRFVHTSEAGGSLTVEYRQDRVVRSGIWGILAIHRAALMGRPKDAFKPPDQELARHLFSIWKDVPWKGDVLVRVGGTDLHNDIKRFRAYADAHGFSAAKRSRIEKTLRHQAEMDAVYRSTYYNPFTKTVHIHSPQIAVAMHEMGHAYHHDVLGSIPKGLAAEWYASKKAMEFMDPAARRQAATHLEPAFATYLSKPISMVVGAAMSMHNIVKITRGERVGPKDVARVILSAPLVYYLTTVAAHIISRLPFRRRSFGYIFEGTTAPEPLKPRQVLVAPTRPGG